MNAELTRRARSARDRLVEALLAERGPAGHWTGELSRSALSTATAVAALAGVDREAHAGLIHGGLDWLAAHANPDGGWGTWCAAGAIRAPRPWPGRRSAPPVPMPGTPRPSPRRRRICAGRRARSTGVSALEALYGTDRTFSVPITMTLALAGRLGPDGWRLVRRLPFELAALPRGLFGALRLPVVSYALPALIAIGQVVHHHRGGFRPIRSLARNGPSRS